MGKSKQVKKIRTDRKHRFPLRISSVTHNEAETISFRQNVSLNLFYVEAINYAMNSDGFEKLIQNKYVRDATKGHFTFHQDTQTLRRGRLIE